MKNYKPRQIIALLTAFSLTFSQFVQVAEAVTLAATPLANSTTSVVRPNIMYVLDTSGSMDWDYSPDYVNDTVSSTTWGMCWGVSGSGGTGGVPLDTNKAVQCSQDTQVPYATSAINYQFYDPAVYYQPPLHADGSAYPDSTPTAAKSDGFKSSSTTTNLTTGWKHQVWCTTSTASPTASDPTAGGKCVENSDTSGNHLYPDFAHVYLKTYNGPPDYFKMYPFEYCSDDDRTNCVAATAPAGLNTKPSLYNWCSCYWPALVTPTAATWGSNKETITTGSLHGLTTGKSVTLSGFTPAALDGTYTVTVTSTTAFTIPKAANPGAVTVMGKVTLPPVGSTASCPTNTGTRPNFMNCQARRDSTHLIPNYLGAWDPSGSPAIQAYANMQILSVGSGQSITSLKVDGVELLAFDNTNSTLVGNGNTPSNPPAPGTDPDNPVSTAANIYASIQVGSSFPFYQGTADYTSAPFDSPNPAYVYNSYVPSTISTTYDVALALCQAAQANSASSGYSCKGISAASDTASGKDELQIMANNVGAAPNGKLVVVSGPSSTSAINAVAAFTVNDATAGKGLTSLKITTPAGIDELLSTQIIANGNANTAAQDICNAIKSGPKKDVYEALSGGSTTYGTCSSGSASISVRVKTAGEHLYGNGTDSVNGSTFAGTNSGYTGTISVTGVSPVGNTLTTYNATKIDDITIGGTSILTATYKPLTWKDGTSSPSEIAAAIAQAITNSAQSTCTATSSNEVVTIRGASCGAISSAISVSAADQQASATFSVSAVGQVANVPATLGTSSANGSIQVNSIKIADILTATDLSNGAAKQQNADAIGSKIHGLVGSTGLDVAAAVASSGNYNVTVSTTDGRSTYNEKSFTFQDGTAIPSGGQSSAQWTFSITNATTANKKITSIKCGTTDTITQNIATTGAASAATRIANLATGSSTNGLDGKTYNNYSWTCSANGACTLTGPVGAAACTNLNVSVDNTGWSSFTPYITTNSSRTNAGSDGQAETWTYNITGATTDSKKINSVTCGGLDTIAANTASTGNSGSYYASVLANDIETQQHNAGNSNNFSQTNGSCSVVDTSTGRINCQLAMSNGTGNRCSGQTLYINGLSAALALADPSSTPSGTSGSAVNHVIETLAGTRYWYSFDVTGATAASKSITSIACSTTTNGLTKDNSNVAASSASTGNATSTNQLTATRINNLTGSMSNNNSFSTSCTTATSSNRTSTCTITVPTGTSCPSVTVTPENSSGITASMPTKVTSYAAMSSPTWNFNITGASADSKNIQSVTCGGTNTFNTAAKPSTGTIQAYQYIYNLTQNATNGLNAIDINGASDSFTYSCSGATSSTTAAQCTVTGPLGTAASACNASGNLVITPESSSGLTFLANGTSYASPTSVNVPYDSGHAGGTASQQTNFISAMGTVAPSAFTNAYKAQTTSTSGSMSQVTNPVIGLNPATPAFGVSTGGSGSVDGVDGAILTIPTNATGTAPNDLVMTGGADASTSNAWTKVGIFKRTDIVSSTTAYPRAATRSDCANAGYCTYTEELQNFANWYTYYRTRMQMMKSSSTIAFGRLDDKYRLGFDDICSATGTTIQLNISQFSDSGEAANQRTNWWNKLTTATPSCATPLRAEAAKIGRYYAHKLSSSLADPVQYSCQQNFMFLVTDGYWNESDSTAIKRVDGTDIGNTDNNVAIAPRPYYDGQQASDACPTVGSNRSGASSCRTLADIAWHYYSTDIRDSSLSNATNATTGDDVATNNVPTTSDDRNAAQHMVFYGMGLGVDGTLKYRSDYQTAGVGDYAEIVAGTRNWPAAANLDPTAVDDLWHATVSGHGKYFSARNPTSVLAGLTEALVKIGSRVGSAAAAATSNLEPVAGDNFAYVASYVTGEWFGDLQARDINLTTGAVSTTANWSAQVLLDSRTWSTREIFIVPTSGTSGASLRAFNYTNLTTAEQAQVDPGSLSQYTGLFATNPTEITGETLVNFLRGDRSLEQDGDASHTQIWRKRTHVLGDIVDTQPVFVKKPNFYYTDTGYADFKVSGTAFSRKPVAYVSAQDGMLHAFNADTASVTSTGGVSVPPGGELWAYIPKLSMAAMKNLGDVAYTHQYFVDGQISVGDVYFGSAWHTILVAGLGAGGKGYFALDVTDPINPKFLWEISSATSGFSGLGYTFGNASINKLIINNLPTWSVLFTSGYNNADSTGHLYAVDAQTGTMLSGYPLDTTASNLGKLGVWANDPIQDNTGQFAYAGDLNGNLWRFDLNPTATLHTGTGNEVFKLANLTNASGTAQPISTKPEATLLDDGTFVIYVGTGQYLGIPDLTTTDVQTFYAIKDSFSTTTTWDPRNDTGTIGGVPNSHLFLQRKLIGAMDNGAVISKTVNGVTSSIRQICNGASSQVSHVDQSCINESGGTMDWAIYDGWFVDLPDTGERMNVDMNLSLGTLTFATNVPASSACTSGGYSWVNYLDYKTGLQVQNTGAQVSTKVSNALVVGINVVKLPSGSLTAIVTTSDNQQLGIAPSFSPTSFSGKRSLWREFEAY